MQLQGQSVNGRGSYLNKHSMLLIQSSSTCAQLQHAQHARQAMLLTVRCYRQASAPQAAAGLNVLF